MNSISQICKNYYDQLPDDGLRAIGFSTLYSFFASVTIITLKTLLNQPTRGLNRSGLAAGIAFVATTIHVMTTPIFNYLFNNPNNQQFNGWQEMVKAVSVEALTQMLINSTGSKANIITAWRVHNDDFLFFPNNIMKISLYLYTYLHTYFGIPTNFAPPNSANSTPIYLTA